MLKEVFQDTEINVWDCTIVLHVVFNNNDFLSVGQR